MKFNFKNLSENTKRIRIIPKNDTELFANIGVDNPTAMIDEAGIFSVCLSPYETPTNSCDDSPSSIILPLTGGSYYEIVDGDAVYGSILRNLIVGARDQNYFEGLRFEVVTGTDIDPTTVRIVNLTDNSKRIKFTAIDANSLNERYFAEKGLNYAETVLAHNVESLGDGIVFEFCLGVGGDNGEIPFDEMHFTTIEGSVVYIGQQGDQIFLSDGTILDVTGAYGELTFNAPAGRHIVKFVESADRSNHVSLGGEALIELHNFPTLSTVTRFDLYPDIYSPNLVKVPTILPSNLTHLTAMFYGATSFNQDISMWDVSNVTDMSYMFDGATTFDQPLNNWDVSNVTTMNGMFYNAKAFNQPLNNWDVSNVTNMGEMFNNASAFNQDISSWNVSNVTNMAYMFFGAASFNQPLNNWDVSNVNRMFHMFMNATTFNQPLNNWDISNVNGTSSMFADAIAFDQPLDNWDTSNVIDMSGMFYGATSFDQDISSWDVSNVTNMDYMFGNALAFNQNLSQWCVSNITSSPLAFDQGATSWTLPRPVWGTCPSGETSTIFCDGATDYVDFAILVREGVSHDVVSTSLSTIFDGEILPPMTPPPDWVEESQADPFPYEIPNGFQNATLTPRFYNLSGVNRRIELKSLSDDIQVIAYSNPTSVQLSNDNSHAGACLSEAPVAPVVVPISCEGSPHRVSFYVTRIGQGGNTTFYLEYKTPNGDVLTEADLNSMGVQVSEYDDAEEGFSTSFYKQGDAFPAVRFIVTLVQVGNKEFVLSHDYSGNATVVEEGVSYGVCLATPF